MKKLVGLVLALMMLYCGFLTYQIEQLKQNVPDEGGETVTHVNKTVTGFSTDLTKVIDQVSVSVVHVEMVDASNSVYEGSGIIYSIKEDQTIIVTSASYTKNVSEISVTFGNGESVAGTLIGIDALTDLAVISTTPSFSSTPITLGDSSVLSLGEWLIAIGSEGRKDFSPSLSVGLLSGINRPYDAEIGPDQNYELNVMVSDLDIGEGTSGGAVVNMQGELIGISSLKMSSENEALIVPVEEVEEVVRMILENQEVVRPTLGISTTTISELTAYQKSQLSIQLDLIEGLYIHSIEHMGPCDLALMQVGDILLEFNGTKLLDYNSLRTLLYACSIGDTVELTVLRGNETSKVMVTLQ